MELNKKGRDAALYGTPTNSSTTNSSWFSSLFSKKPSLETPLEKKIKDEMNNYSTILQGILEKNKQSPTYPVKIPHVVQNQDTGEIIIEMQDFTPEVTTGGRKKTKRRGKSSRFTRRTK